MITEKLRAISAIVLLCLLSAGAGFYIGGKETSKMLANLGQGHPLREQRNEFKFISPLLAYESAPANTFKEFTPLENKLNETIEAIKDAHKARAVSVYYKDLNSGKWVGINENDQYIPASLLKAVIMIAYYKQAETNPETLTRKLQFTKIAEQEKTTNPYDAPSTLEDHKDYSISDLISKMIIDSDNGAKDLLLNNIDKNSLNEVYTDLGLKNPDESADLYTISAKNYSLFFRVLYNGTYLSRQFSEQALELLSRATFSDGLISGVPKDTAVAHKFGESVRQTSNSNILEIELHDCGIVYKPNKPFLLCVMTKGSNLEGLKSSIQELTRAVYNQD